MCQFPTGPRLDEANDVAQAHLALASTGQTDMVWDHVRVRDPDGRGVWMKTAGWGFDEITPDRVVLVSPNGDVVEGTGRRHIEYPIHTELMAARADIGAVVHSHAPAAAVFAPAEPVDVLLAPIAGPWMKLSEGIDFVRKVGPRAVIPIHDGGLTAAHRDLLTSFLPGGTELTALNPGETVVVRRRRGTCGVDAHCAEEVDRRTPVPCVGADHRRAEGWGS